jgi:hypothetical protein
MNLDTLGEQAARALRAAAASDAAVVDTDAALRSLRERHRRRSAVRGIALTGAAAVAVAGAVVGGPQLWEVFGNDRVEPSRAVDFPPLGPGYDVIATSVSPAGTAEAVATYREGQPAVVLLRTSGSASSDVAWSAPTAHELGDLNVPFPAAVGWAPDGSRIAILVGQERGRVDTASDPVDLTLLTVNPDGTTRQTLGDVGTCRCSAALPTLTWSGDQLAISIPDGPDEGHYTKEMP